MLQIIEDDTLSKRCELWPHEGPLCGAVSWNGTEMSDDDSYRGLLGRSLDALKLSGIVIMAMVAIGAAAVIWFIS
jgi:hypothetical protein